MEGAAAGQCCASGACSARHAVLTRRVLPCPPCAAQAVLPGGPLA
jgi:hypothetical protein